MFSFPMTYIGIPLSQFPKDIPDAKLIHSLDVLGDMVRGDLKLDRAELFLKDYNLEDSENCIKDQFSEQFVTKLLENRDTLLSKNIDFCSDYAGSGEYPIIFGFYVHGKFGEQLYPTSKEMTKYEKNLEEFKNLMKSILDEKFYTFLIKNNAIRLDFNNHTT